MRIHFMLAYARNLEAPNPVLQQVFHLLHQGGCEVDIGIAGEVVWSPSEPRVAADLYVLKSHTQLWLSLAEILYHRGARILNPYPSCRAAQNKLVNAWLLSAAGIPIPRTWIPGDLALLRSLVAERPLIIKPYLGRRNEGIVVVQSPAELDRLAPPSAPVLVQEYLRDHRVEIKVAVIGAQVFAVRKVAREDGKIERAPYLMTEEIRSVALACGRVFGFGLYGMDMLLGDAGPVVIDLDYFPSYGGIEGAAPLIAEYILSYARGILPELEPWRPIGAGQKQSI
jgi:ribosomal protein S6--L-glutamate ligase